MNSQDRNAEVITHEGMGASRVLFTPKGHGDTDQHAAAMIKAGERVQTLDATTTFVSVNTGHGNAASQDGTIRAAVSTSGMPRSGTSIDEDSLIEIEGIPVKIRDAIGMGLVSRNANGSFSLVGKA